MRIAKIWTIFATVAVYVSPLGAGAAEESGAERVTVEDQNLLAYRNGAYAITTNLVKLPFDIEVNTNLTFRVAEGRERPLKEGQVLSQDGTILNPDGTTHPVYDHIMMYRNQIRVMRDGDYATLSGSIKLGDGSLVTDDCYIQGRDGIRHRLQDGQTFRLGGATVASKDTVTLLKGKVVVQKEGSSFPVAPGALLMMNEGTRVFGDGYLLRGDGTRVNLVEGETIQLEGIVVRR